MATVTKSWTVSGEQFYVQINDATSQTVTNASHTIVCPSCQAKVDSLYVSSRCALGVGFFLANNSTGNDLLDSSNCPIEIGGENTTYSSPTTYRTITLSAVNGQISTSVLFNSSNSTSKTITTALYVGPTTATGTYSYKDAGGWYEDDYGGGSVIPATRQKIATMNFTLNAPPTFSVTNLSYSPNLSQVLANYTTVSTTVSNLSAKYGGTISSVVFKIGSQTVSGTTNKTYSIVPNTTGTFTPTLTVTDSRGQVTTHTFSAITVVANQAPSVSATITSSNPYYVGVSSKPFTVTVSNATAYQGKSVSSVTVKLGSQTSTKTSSFNSTYSITPNTVGEFSKTNDTLYVTITDSSNLTTKFTWSDSTKVTVYANTAPSCSYSVTSSAPYYAGLSTYSVNITNPTAPNKTVSSIVLNVGGQTASRSTAGALSVTVPSTAGSVTPTITITDNMGASQSYSLTAISVTANTEPTCTVTWPSGTNFYVNANSYSVSISNVSVQSGKTVSSIVLNVNGQTVSRTNAGTLSITPSGTGTSVRPTVVITDSSGTSKTYSASSTINIYANTPPSFQAATTSSGNYYAGISNYSVSLTGVTAQNNKTISQTKLQIGTQSVTGTGNGTLTIKVSTADTFTPVVTVTDNMGASTSVNMSSLTVLANTPPTATVAVTDQSPYYENLPSSFTTRGYKLTVSNVQTFSNKTIAGNGIKLTIGSQTAQRSDAGALSILLSQAGTFTPVVTITDNIGATTTYNQPAITVYQRSVTVSNITVSRIAASTDEGTVDRLADVGTHVVIKATFTRSQITGNYLKKPTVAIAGTTTTNVTWYTSWSNSSGFSGEVNWTNYNPSVSVTLYAKVTNTFVASNSYLISITPDSTAITGTAGTSTVAQAFFLLAGKAGGHALGIGKKPVMDGVLDIGMESVILNNYNGNPPSIDYQGAYSKYKMIKFKDGSDTYGNGLVLGGGGLVVVGAGESADAVAATYSSGGTEELALASDGNIRFWTSANSGAASAHQETIDTSGIYSGRAGNVYVPRIGNANTIDLNSVPSQYFGKFGEYGPSCVNLPSAHWYFVTTWRGADNNYCAQLAIGETTEAAYYRVEQNGTWGSWKSITNTDTNTTYSAGAGLTLSGTTFSAPMYMQSVSCSGNNTANYPWHRFATTTTGTGAYVDKSAIVILDARCNGGRFGVVKIGVRVNEAGGSIQTSAQWLYRYNFDANNVVINTTTNTVGTNTTINAYVKCGTWPRMLIYFLQGANLGWTLVASNEVSDTTTSDKKGSVEVYASVSPVANATDSATVNYANSAGTATSATSATSATTATTATTANTLGHLGRLTTADTLYGDGKGRITIASSSMTTNKPLIGGKGAAAAVHDALILTLPWDNNGGFDTQLAISNDGSGLSIRGGTGKTGTAQNWTTWAPVAMASAAISNITRSGTTFTATRANGTTFTFTQQDNNTTYSSLAAASGGTAVSLCTTGEKYTWNAKQNALSVADWTSQITTGLSGLTVTKAVKYGNVCQIEFNWTKSTAVASGANAFEQTLTTLPYKPACDVQGVGYYGGRSFVCWLTTAGKLTCRNASSSSATPSANGGLYFSVTYICS